MLKKPIAFLRNNMTEFGNFAFKGNLIQLAIGVVLGVAFGKLVTSFVDNLFMPLLSVFTRAAGEGTPGYLHWQWQGIRFGAFLGDLINFLIVALAIFVLMVKVIGWIISFTKKAAGTQTAPSEPTEKECPLCLMKIPLKASRCGHCAADLPQAGGVPTVVV